MKKKELPVLTIDEEFKHHMATECYICENKFYKDEKNNYIKVRDHGHYTGKYRGAAHKIFNLIYNTPREIPLRRCYQNRKVPGSNPARRSAGLRDPTSLRGSR